MHLLGSDLAKSTETLGEVVSFEASEIAPPGRFKTVRIRQRHPKRPSKVRRSTKSSTNEPPGAVSEVGFGVLPKSQKSDPRAPPKRPGSARAPKASQVSLLEPFLK